jgi:LytS/YehU family sensor histidine kinase
MLAHHVWISVYTAYPHEFTSWNAIFTRSIELLISMRCKSAEDLLQDQLTRLAEVKALEIQQLKRIFNRDPDAFLLSRRQL